MGDGPSGAQLGAARLGVGLPATGYFASQGRKVTRQHPVEPLLGSLPAREAVGEAQPAAPQKGVPAVLGALLEHHGVHPVIADFEGVVQCRHSGVVTAACRGGRYW